MSALLALLLAAAPGCRDALDAAAASPDEVLAERAPALVQRLEALRAGPTAALAASAAELAAARAPRERAAAALVFRDTLQRHCALAAATVPAEASPADRAALAEVLARPELSRVRIDPWALRRALVRLWDWIVERLGTAEAEEYANLGRALFLGAAAAALALVLAALRRRWRAGREAAAATAPGPVAPRAAQPGATPDLAEEALRRGDAREAVRLSLLAALDALERAGRIPPGKALTNEEVLRLAEVVPAASGGTSDLARLALVFDRTVYGDLPVAPGDARAAVEGARRVATEGGATA